jgi:hypothetical protein
VARRSSAERRLLAFLRDEFGEHLSSLLLSGYLVDERVLARRYAVTASDRAGGSGLHHLELRTLSEIGICLPYGHDPLVLSALFAEMGKQGMVGRLTYDPFDLFELLGWTDPNDGLKAVEGALVRYYWASYAAVKKRRHPFAAREEMRSPAARLVVSYDLEIDSSRAGKGQAPLYAGVEFNPWFLDCLRRGTLLGIDWSIVSSVDLE